MSVVVVNNHVTEEDLKIARQDYGDYIKIVIDLNAGAMAIGGEWHAEGESKLLELGSHQANLWGGGVDSETHEVSYSALTNIKSGVNSGHVILSPQVRDRFDKIVKEKFDYE